MHKKSLKHVCACVFDPEMVESSCIVKSGKSRKITENHGNILTLPSTEMGGSLIVHDGGGDGTHHWIARAKQDAGSPHHDPGWTGGDGIVPKGSGPVDEQ